MSDAIEMTGLVKQFPGFTLGPVGLRASSGRAIALIGPNGAGKTTMMDMLAGVTGPAAGQLQVLGRPQGPQYSKHNLDIGYATDNQPFFENWTGRRNLSFISSFYPAWSPELQAKLAQRLDVQLDKKVSTLSRGNRVKLALVSALARQSQLLLLDEPTAGLCPLVRGEVLDVLFEYLGDDRHTLIYSTHILADVSRLADELIFIRNGRLILQAERDDLEANWRRLTFRIDAKQLSATTMELFTEYEVQGSLHRGTTYDFPRLEDQLRALGAVQLDANLMSLEEISVQVLRSGTRSAKPDTSERREHVNA